MFGNTVIRGAALVSHSHVWHRQAGRQAEGTNVSAVSTTNRLEVLIREGRPYLKYRPRLSNRKEKYIYMYGLYICIGRKKVIETKGSRPFGVPTFVLQR